MKKFVRLLEHISWFHACDGQFSVAEVAQSVGQSEATVRRHFHALIEVGVIQWRSRGMYAIDERSTFGQVIASIQLVYNLRLEAGELPF